MPIHIENEITEPNDRSDLQRAVEEALRDRPATEAWRAGIRPDQRDPVLYVLILTAPSGSSRRVKLNAFELGDETVREKIRSAVRQKAA